MKRINLHLEWLYYVKYPIEEIEGYFVEFPKDFNQYSSNLVLKRAVERDLEIIGKVVNRILNRDAEFPLKNAYKIVGLRND